MDYPICKLGVSRFRSLRDLRVGPFGRVNLITGKNNAGKSSLLEAIRILVTEGSPTTFYSILNYREEVDQRPEEAPVNITPQDSTSFCSLFTGFPSLAGCEEAITISNENGGHSPVKTLSVRVGWFTEEYTPEQGRRLVRADADLFGEASGFPALEVELPNRRRVIRIDRARMYRRTNSETGEGVTTPCVFLDPFSSRSTSQLAAFWDAIALTDAEKEVVRALQIISPDIEAVSMIGSDTGPRSRTAIAKSQMCSHPVPLRSFGDGVNRLFGIILSLSCARGGVLLIDEIENGLHHSILTDVWRVIFRMARQLGVQVFATSHSWDCIKSFQEAANEDPDEGVLARLSVKGESVIPTLFREAELRIATREQIELR